VGENIEEGQRESLYKLHSMDLHVRKLTGQNGMQLRKDSCLFCVDAGSNSRECMNDVLKET
jgi:hypothetical protein